LLPFNFESLLGHRPMMQHQKLEIYITTRYYDIFSFMFMPLTSNFLLLSSPIESVILGIHMHVCVYIWAPSYYALLMTIKFSFYVFIWFWIIHHYLSLFLFQLTQHEIHVAPINLHICNVKIVWLCIKFIAFEIILKKGISMCDEPPINPNKRCTRKIVRKEENSEINIETINEIYNIKTLKYIIHQISTWITWNRIHNYLSTYFAIN
jgi:hypothetical protein